MITLQQIQAVIDSGTVGGPVSSDPLAPWEGLTDVDQCQAAIAIIQGWLLIPIDQWPYAETQAHRDARLQDRIALLQGFIDGLNSQGT